MRLSKLLATISLSMVFGSELAGAEDYVFEDYDKGFEAYKLGDYEAALVEWLPLAQQGNGDALYWIAVLYDDGRGVPESDKEEVKWYVLSAAQGIAEAKYRLGEMHYNGTGVLKDYKRAYMWYALSVYNEFSPAKHLRDRVGSVLTVTEAAKAREMARRCLESDYTDC